MKTKFLRGLPWKRLIKVGKPYWTSEKKWRALLNLSAVLVLMFANSYLGAFLVRTQGDFMTAVEHRNMPEFTHLLLVWVGTIFIAVPIVQTFYAMLRTRLALNWRSWMSTNVLFHAYFANHSYYKLLTKKDIDNPDQRMTADVDSFCNTSVGLFISVLDSFTTICMYSYVLWTVMPGLPIEVFGLTAATSVIVLWGCKLMLPFLVGICSMIGNAAVLYIGRELPNINYNLAESEASLRFNLAETRREAETVAFARGEQIAELQANQGLTRVIGTLFRMMYLFRNMGFFTNPYNMLVPIIPTALMGYMYTQGMIPLGTITTAAGAFMAVYGGATLLMGQFGGIMGYATTINRVGTLMDELETAAAAPPRDGKHIDVIEGSSIRYDNLTVATPDGEKDLIVGLNVDIKQGSRVLITGAHGSGKTALLRVTAGFWSRGKGKLQRLPYANMMFLTSSPYFPPMTLRQALCYPSVETCNDDDKLLQALTLAKLSDLPARAGGLDTMQTWREMLSPSEQQRLSLARVMLQKPTCVFIDEGTSALEEDVELFFYSLLFSLGCTVITAGVPGLAKYHDSVIEILPEGTWRVYKASDGKPDGPPAAGDQNHVCVCPPPPVEKPASDEAGKQDEQKKDQ
jgi:putative ATP-binding cassette transporter